MENKCRAKYGLLGKDKAELMYVLHTSCANNCEFCIQQIASLLFPTQRQKIDKATVARIYNLADKSLNDFMTPYIQRVKSVDIKVMGGELFQGDLEKSGLWDAYWYFFNKLIENADKAGITISIRFITNLSYETKNLEKVFEILHLCKSFPWCDCRVGTSFDLWGRFHNATHLRLWEHHFELLLSECKKLNMTLGVEMVLNKSTFNILKSRPETHKDELAVFDRLYDMSANGLVDLDMIRFHSSNPATHKEILKDTELAQAYKFLLVNYPEIGGVRMFLERKGTDCFGGYDGYATDEPDKVHNICVVFNAKDALAFSPELSPEESLKKHTMCMTSLDHINDFDYVFESYIKHNNCFACPHFRYCKKDCMELWNMKINHTDPDSHYCWLKDVYDFVNKEFPIATA